MEEYGKYSKHVLGSYCCNEEVITLIDKALGQIQFSPEEGPFVVCDYGTADGGSSMSLIRHIIDWVQEQYGAEQQVHIIYEDKEDNDFKSLILRVHGYIPDPPSYLKDHKNVFVTFSATSFYSQCLPDSSVHLGFSGTAMHWLSKRPCKTSSEMHTMYIEDEQEKQMFKVQAAKDWQTNLLHRVKELKLGGHMVILSPNLDGDGQYTGNTKIARNHRMIKYHWQTLRQEGLITQKEFEAIHFNFYNRTRKEFVAPFEDTSSDVSKAGLKLLSIETKIMPCPYNIRWLDQGKDGDIMACRNHARDYVDGMRPWTEEIFLFAFRSRPEGEAKAVIEEFYRRAMAEVTQNPSDYGVEYVYSRIHIAKNKKAISL